MIGHGIVWAVAVWLCYVILQKPLLEWTMPKPKTGESEKEFVSRCIPIVIDEGELDQEQAAGRCYGIYRSWVKKKKKGRK